MRSWEVPNRLSHKSLADPKSAEELRALCTTILERETEDLGVENDRKNAVNKKGKKQTVSKKQRNL